MPDIEKAKFFNVTGPIDRPKRTGEGIAVMFNPSTLKVTLANAIGENQRSGNTRAAQYVDKSSSSLTVELIFDSSDEYDQQNSVRKDVRTYTGAIANEFMHQSDVGNKKAEPKRCMFAWGTFVFTGIMESFDETLDFFSWEGTPLRATVAIKMTESRFQFETEDAKQARRNTPRLGREAESAPSAAAGAGQDPKNWRDTSMFNGVESPRMPSSSPLAVPGTSPGSGGFGSGGGFGGGGFGGGALGGGGIGGGLSGGLSGGVTGGLSAGAGISGGLSGGLSGGAGFSSSFSDSASFSAGVSGSAGFGGTSSFSTASASFTASSVTPAFSFGASSSLGTGIPGAFTLNASGSMSAGSIKALGLTSSGMASASGGSLNRGSRPTGQASARADLQLTPGGIKGSASLGFD